MPHPLSNKLNDLATAWNRRVTTAAVAGGTGAVIIVLMIAGSIDYLIRWQDVTARALLSLTTAAAIAAALRAVSKRGLVRRRSAFAVARCIEQLRPEFGDRLASAVTFLSQDESDGRGVSAELRRRVINQATADSDLLPPATEFDMPEEKPAWRMLGAATMVALLLVAFSPLVAATALTRLALPWHSISWPRQVHLELVDLPPRVARGDELEIVVSNSSGELPDDTKLEFRYRADGRQVVSPLPASRQDSRLVGRRQNVQRSFDVRAVGGDDRAMPWQQVEVVDPPQLAESRLQVTPPSYSGITPYQTDRALRLLVGSRVEWQARADVPIEAARVAIQSSPPQTIPARIVGSQLKIDGERWMAKLLDEPTTYRTELERADGIVGTSPAYPYEVLPDAPPTIDWISTTTQDPVTQRALLALTVSAGDDLAIRCILLDIEQSGVADRGEASGPRTFDTFAVHDHGEAPPTIDRWPRGGVPRGEFDAVVDLANFDLNSETSLSIVATARDYAGQQTSTSTPITVDIVSDEMFARLVADSQRQIASQIARALDAQRAAQVAAARMAVDDSTQSASRLDSLSATILQQRQVATLLSDTDGGALARAKALVARIAANRVDLPAAVSQLNRVVEVLLQLVDQPLPQIDDRFSVARQALEQSLREGDTAAQQMRDALSKADNPQRVVIAALEELLDGIEQWGDTEQLGRELAEIETGQRQLAARAAALADEQMQSAARGDSNDTLAARAQTLANEQAELARRFQRLRQQLADLAAQSDLASELRDRIADALATADDSDIARSMDDARAELAQGQPSRASAAQRKAADDLARMVQTLSGKTPTSEAELAEALRDAAALLAQLRSDTRRNASRADSGDQQQERQRLAERMQQLARQLRKLTAPDAASSAAAAADSMQQPNQPSPEQQADQQLQQAEEQLKGRLAEIEQQREQRALERLAAELQRLLPQQREVIADTLQIEQELPADGNLPAELVARCNELATRQQEIASQLRVAIDNVAARQVFALALRGAADDMERAARRLAEHDPRRVTQQAELDALSRLQQVAEILTTPPAEPNEQDDPASQNANNNGNNSQQPPPIIELAEVKMIRWLQVELNGRTRRAEAELAESPAVERSDDLGRLAAEQQRLAALIGEMLERRGNPEADKPDL